MSEKNPDGAVTSSDTISSAGKAAAQIAAIHFERTGVNLSALDVGTTAGRMNTPFIQIDEGGKWGPRKYYTDIEPILARLKLMCDTFGMTPKPVEEVPVSAPTPVENRPDNPMIATAIAARYTERTGKPMAYQTVHAIGRDIEAPSFKKWHADSGRKIVFYTQPDLLIEALIKDAERWEEIRIQSDLRRAETPDGWFDRSDFELLLPHRLLQMFWAVDGRFLFMEVVKELGFIAIHDHYDPAWMQPILQKILTKIKGSEAYKHLDMQELMAARKIEQAAKDASNAIEKAAMESRTITPFPDDFDLDYEEVDESEREKTLCCAIAYNSKWRVILAWAYNYSCNNNQYFIDIEGAKGEHASIILTGDYEYQDFIDHSAHFATGRIQHEALRRTGNFLSMAYKSERLRITHSDQAFFAVTNERILLHAGGAVDFKNDLIYFDIARDALPLIAEVAAFENNENGLVLMPSLPSSSWFVPSGIDSHTSAKAAEQARQFEKQQAAHKSEARKTIIGRLAAVNQAIAQHKKR